MAFLPLSSDRLTELSPARRLMRDIPGITESRPGVFAAGRATLVEFLDQDGSAVARLAAQGHGNPTIYRLDDAAKRRSLVDAVRLRVKRQDDD